jgi:hypothetical protein
MHPSAQAAWQTFITRYEGNIAHMYLDTKGLVTIGIGNLIDPVSAALGLPFQFKASNRIRAAPGRVATQKEIEAEWLSLKNNPSRTTLTRRGAVSCIGLTDLELIPADRQRLFDRVTSEHEIQLVTYFSDFRQWPGDAQLGLMAMAWGLGKYFPPKFPNFSAECRNKDFDTAASQSSISSWRPERNQASKRCFGNAARVIANPDAYDVARTYYPVMLLDTIQATA